MRKIILWTVATLTAIVTPTIACAQSEPLDIRQSYSGTSTIPVFDIATYNTYANGTGISNSFSIDPGVFSFEDGFLKSSANPPLFTYFLGVSSDVPASSLLLGSVVSSDSVAASQHLVLALTSAYAAGLVSGGEDFSTIFPDYDENSLIADLETIGSNSGNTTIDAKTAAYQELFGFGGTIESRNGLTPAQGGPLTLLSFSNGVAVGQGTSTLTPLDITTPAVPEPAAWAMMIVGMGAIGVALRRRQPHGRVRFA